MNNLTVFNKPIKFDEFLKNMFLQPISLLNDELAISIKTDIHESDKEYTVSADIPGAKKEDIEANVNGHRLTIRAQFDKEVEQQNNGQVIQSERYHGEALRVLEFEQEVDPALCKVHYQDGVLKLVLPKKSPSNNHNLKIN